MACIEEKTMTNASKLTAFACFDTCFSNIFSPEWQMAVFFLVSMDHLQSTVEQESHAFASSQLEQLLKPAFPATYFFLKLIIEDHNS